MTISQPRTSTWDDSEVEEEISNQLDGDVDFLYCPEGPRRNKNIQKDDSVTDPRTSREKSHVVIYVRHRKIIRNGKVVDGFQAGFQPKGGVTCESKEQAIEHQRLLAERLGAIVERIEEPSDD
jgi:hypothetical protein